MPFHFGEMFRVVAFVLRIPTCKQIQRFGPEASKPAFQKNISPSNLRVLFVSLYADFDPHFFGTNGICNSKNISIYIYTYLPRPSKGLKFPPLSSVFGSQSAPISTKKLL